MSSLIEHRLFPQNPHWNRTISNFNTSLSEPVYGQLLRAYLFASESGLYYFNTSCNDACVFWIGDQHGDTFMRCRINITTGVNLTAGLFYKISVIHVGGNDTRGVKVSLTTPSGSKEDRIPEKYLVAYNEDGILGEFTPGDWAPWGSCDARTEKQTRHRRCQNFPPLYSRLNTTIQVNESRDCNIHCPEDWVNFNDFCYRVIPALTNWTEARKTCMNINSDLASIASQTEGAFIVANLTYKSVRRTRFWLGLKNDTSTFVWSDSSEVTYISTRVNSDFNSTPPYCGSILSSIQGVWEMLSCSKTKAYAICKRKAFFVDNGTCIGSPLGVETGVVKDHQMTASSYLNKTTKAHQARLAGPSAWCSKTYPAFLKIDLKILHSICAVATQGFLQQGFYAIKYFLQLGPGNKPNLYLEKNAKDKVT